MKKVLVLGAMMLTAVVGLAKDIKTVVFTTNPQMHCENCEKKIKGSLRFEKGIKNIITNLNSKTVTIEYDADKTNVQNIIRGFKKIKGNLRFEKGIKNIITDLKTKTVTIEYDADKTNVQNIIKGFKKIKYEATEVKKGAVKDKAESKK